MHARSRNQPPTPPAELPAKRFDRRDTWTLLAVVASALLVRTVYVVQYRECPYFDHETMDAGYHDDWAKAIAAGEAFVEGPYFRSPLYPWMLGALYRVTGTNYLAVRLVQAVLGALSCGLVFLIARRIVSRVAAAAAGLAAGTYWILVYFDAELLDCVLSVFLSLLVVWHLVRIAERRTVLRCLVAGLLLGLSAIARPNILLFAPVAAVWLALMQPRWRPSMMAAVAFTAGTMIAILPVTIRNYVAGGDWVLIASQGGVNLFIGNNAEADGVSVHVPGLRPSIDGIYFGTTRQAERETGRDLKPSEVSRFYAGKALDFIGDQPGRAVRLMLTKIRAFWTSEELLNNKHIYLLTDRYTPIVSLLPLGFYIVGTLGLVGLMAAMRGGRSTFPLWSFVIVYMVSVVLFFVNARFRVPVLPVLMILAAYGAERIVLTIRSRNTKAATILIGTAILAGAFVNWPHASSAAKLEETALVDLGRVLHVKGRDDEAILLFNEAIERNPNHAEAMYALGVTYAEMGQLDEAIRLYRRALDVNPNHVSSLNNLGRAMLDRDEIVEAIRLLRRAVDAGPRHAGARFNLGRALESAGQLDEAARWLTEGLTLEDDRVDMMVRLVNVQRRRGAFAEAAAALQQALTFEPDNAALLIQHCQLHASIESIAHCDKAKASGEKAIAVVGRNDFAALDALAAAYAECEEWQRAVTTQQEAIDQASRQGAEPRRIADMTRRLELFDRREKFRVE